MSSILRKYISFVLEAAVPANQAAAAGLALFQTDNRGNGLFILYDVNKLTSDENPVVGMIRVDEPNDTCNHAGVIIISAADKGFGPLLYDIAMEKYPGGLTADRYSVSPAARHVWTYYAKNRGDVDKKPFDDIDNPQTPDPTDDCVLHDKEHPGTDPLDFSYKSSSGVQVSQLVANHQRAVEKTGSNLEGYLIKMSNGYAGERYNRWTRGRKI